MSEGTAKEITCKNCNEKVPLGKFCINCASGINIESTDGGVNDGLRPPIQASDASSSSSSDSGTKSSSQQNSGKPVTVEVSSTNNSGSSHQSNTVISTVTSTGTSTTTVTSSSSSSYADVVKSPQQSVQQNQQSSSLAGDVTINVHSDPSSAHVGHRDTREGSKVANGATGKPDNSGNSFREVATR